MRPKRISVLARKGLPRGSPFQLAPQINSASRVRFRPPVRRTFGLPPCGFCLRSTGLDSTYSRPLLAARGNLGGEGAEVKGVQTANPANCAIFLLATRNCHPRLVGHAERLARRPLNQASRHPLSEPRIRRTQLQGSGCEKGIPRGIPFSRLHQK